MKSGTSLRAWVAVWAALHCGCAGGAGPAATDASDAMISADSALDVGVPDVAGEVAPDVAPAEADANADADAEPPADHDAQADTGPLDGENADHPWVAPAVAINEVQCQGDEWVELINLDPVLPAPLAGLILTDAPDGDPDHLFALAADAEIAPGGFLVIAQTTDDAEGFDFGIGCDADTLALLGPGGAVVDTAPAGAPEDWESWGRLPDGTGDWGPTAPTPGAPNGPSVEPPDPSDALFDPDAVHGIALDLPPTSEAVLVESPTVWVPATLTFTGPDGQGGADVTQTHEVSVRLKGRYGSFRPLGEKSAFKIRLDPQGKSAPLLGIRNLTLNNMVQDHSTLHEVLTYALFRAFDVPAPRVGYVWLSVNDEPYGLYANIETYDDEFLGDHFASTWHLIEGEYGSDVTLDHLEDLDFDEGSAADNADVLALIEAAELAPDEGWFDNLGQVLDTAETLRMWAVEMFVGHWDGYPTVNNYFLHSDDSGYFTMMPWGTDQTWQQWRDYHDGRGILFERCLAAADCREAYEMTLGQLIAVVADLDPRSLGARVAAGHIEEALADPKKEQSKSSLFERIQDTLVFAIWRAASLEETHGCLTGDAPDGDGDGYLCSDDCDDGDPSVHAGAVDLCDDDIDQDCNGWADDGPGCEDCTEMWRGDRRYLYCPVPRPWAEARDRCLAHGADLVITTAATEAAWLAAAVDKSGGDGSYWMGLHDLDEEGAWGWVDGEPLTGFELWGGGEPNDSGGEDCGMIYSNGSWNDLPCDAELPAVCEDPCVAGTDSDGDGFGACGADCDDGDEDVSPAAVDLCEDGIDQDCSGVTDDGDGCAACTAYDRGPHRYWVCEASQDWHDAEDTCGALGDAFLAQVTSEAEQLWLMERMADGPHWIGLSDISQEGMFVWHDGTPASGWTPWAPNEPNDYGSGEDCGELHPSGAWNDFPCAAERRFLCESACAEAGGSPVDDDGDGFDRCSADCDDGDPGIHPDAVDLCGDGIDQDCNSVTDDGPGCDVEEPGPQLPPCQEIETVGASWVWCLERVGWAEAGAVCSDFGGQLAWFDDLEQLLLVRSEATSQGLSGSCWVSYSDQGDEGVFLGADGLPMTLPIWGQGQPDDAGSGEDCGQLLRSGLLNDRPCGEGVEHRPLCRLGGGAL